MVELNKELTKLCEGIGRTLLQREKENLKIEFPASLFYGKGGVVLLFAYLHKELKVEEYKTNTLNILNEIIEDIEEKPYPAGLAYGFTGVAWLIQHMVNIDIISSKEVSFLNDIDANIELSLEIDLKLNQYDLFHGLIGKGLYFLERHHLNKTSAKNGLTKIIDHLDQLKETDGNAITWRDYDEEYVKKKGDQPYLYNLGIPHGIPGIVLFLSYVNRMGIKKQKTKTLIEGTVKWLSMQKRESDFSCFPPYLNHKLEPEESNSRLAWCYGDLTICLAFLHAAKCIGDDNLYKEAIRIGEKATLRDLDNAEIFFDKTDYLDCGFCHGITGVIQLFQAIYQITTLDIFKKALDKWSNILLVHYRKNGFTYHDFKNDQIIWATKTNLLEGLSGTGLVLLNLGNKKLLDYSRIFLLR